MKRKLILQGNKSYTLTLPINWIKEQNLESGDDLEVMPQDTDLLIKGTGGKKEERTVFLDFGEFNWKTIIMSTGLSS